MMDAGAGVRNVGAVRRAIAEPDDADNIGWWGGVEDVFHGLLRRAVNLQYPRLRATALRFVLFSFIRHGLKPFGKYQQLPYAIRSAYFNRF